MDQFLQMLQLDHIITIPYTEEVAEAQTNDGPVLQPAAADENEIDIDQEEDEQVEAADENEIDIDEADEAEETMEENGGETNGGEASAAKRPRLEDDTNN